MKCLNDALTILTWCTIFRIQFYIFMTKTNKKKRMSVEIYSATQFHEGNQSVIEGDEYRFNKIYRSKTLNGQGFYIAMSLSIILRIE